MADYGTPREARQATNGLTPAPRARGGAQKRGGGLAAPDGHRETASAVRHRATRLHGGVAAAEPHARNAAADG
ncbi:hypothetical protein SY87_09580 [Burkholderia pseudomallei]|nr:hypothetical protein [Burkholderia pseudomallei]KIX47521.1 hypothetical protein SY87_09580 [Burkholderia pseudomallei]